MSERPRDRWSQKARRLAWGLGAAGLVAVLGLAAWLVWRARQTAAGPAITGDRWAAYTSPYRNVSPGVRYVGDQVCARCHETEAESYRKHPMGRDLAPLDKAAPLERYSKDAHNPFEALGFQFGVERRGERVYHQAAFRDTEGRDLVRQEQEVQYVIGSGTRTYSYLINHDGFLLESPITWFPQAQIWDLSPGFGRSYLGGRPVREPCLFCHCNHAEHVAGTENRYRPPYFTGFAIGCERCHGPGELHVALREERPDIGPGQDDTIVNPGRLEPVLRESVCQQCHLEGSNRILRRGRTSFDYRPGLPLHQHLSVFVPAPEFGQAAHFIGQAEQVVESRCFKASQGKLGCISCHDPHAVPAPAERVRFFRSRCLTCHKQESCAVPLETRRHGDKEDSCIRCHMVRQGTGDIPHTAVTDHRILRRPERASPPARQEFRLGGMPLAPFYRDLMELDDPDMGRDLGLALVELAWSSPPLRRQAGSLAVPLLEEAVRRWPDDVPAWDAKGRALWLEGKQQEGFADLEHALSLAPQEESVLEAAATMATALGREEAALAYWRQAIALNPWKPACHVNLANLLARRQEWAKARQACKAGLQTDPFNADLRLLYVQALVQASDRDQALAELKTVMSLRPAQADELRRRFSDLLR